MAEWWKTNENRGKMNPKYIISNSFPFSLIRRRVIITPVGLEKTKYLLKKNGFVSTWGHSSTLKLVNNFLGFDITPMESRAAIELDEKNFPTLYGNTYSSIIVISPDYVKGFRPKIGEEVKESYILHWRPLLLDFEPLHKAHLLS